MSDHALIDELRALIDYANARHLHAAEEWLRERVEAAVERMAPAVPVDCWPGFDR